MGEPMFDQFKARAEGVSAEVHRLAGKDEALEFILDFLAKNGAADAPGSYALWADCPFLTGLDRQALARRAPGLKFSVTRELAAQCLIGISQMDWGLANTGTVAANATAVESRLVATLPWIHMAILPTDRILPDLPALLAQVKPSEMAYLSLVTGPSRTADIERVLTIGVHGPERLIIVCVDGLEEVR